MLLSVQKWLTESVDEPDSAALELLLLLIRRQRQGAMGRLHLFPTEDGWTPGNCRLNFVRDCSESFMV